MVEEWVKDARNEARVEANLHAETKKALDAIEQKNKELTVKLTVEERAQKSAKASLQNTRTRLRINAKSSITLR